MSFVLGGVPCFRTTAEETVATELEVECDETEGSSGGLSDKTMVVLLIGEAGGSFLGGVNR